FSLFSHIPSGRSYLPEFRMAEPSMTIIFMMIGAPLAYVLLMCGKKKRSVKETKIAPKSDNDSSFLCENCKELHRGMTGDYYCNAPKKDDPADKPVEELDAVALVEAIEKGLTRPQKDDESIDDHKTDWGKTQPAGKETTGTEKKTEGTLQLKKN
ncbi:hypothetical protein PFISCL1PPCAC_26129, partial [Pristionchus fissidentatus]